MKFLSAPSLMTVVASVIACSCNHHQELTGGVEAGDALATYKVADGFKIEMIASEPLISDPVDMEIDEYGRMYVVEMHGYPLDKSGSGRIMVLTDKDGDGTMDESADRTVSRQEIKSIRSANISAMPSGLARNINYQQMADLISFLREN